MTKDFWVGACALVLAVAVGVALAGGILIIAIDDHADDAQLGTVITTLAGAAVGAVATYLGVRTSNGAVSSAAAPEDGGEASTGGAAGGPPAEDVGPPGR
jgi:hypothetical protein